MAKTEKISDQNWRPALSILVRVAGDSDVISYGQLLARLISVGAPTPAGKAWGARARNIRWTAGKIGEELERLATHRGHPIPPINALVISEDSGIPGPGCDAFVRRFWKQRRRRWPPRLTAKAKEEIYQQVFEDVWSYRYWTGVARRLEAPNIGPDEEEEPGKLIVPRMPRGGRSAAHLRLQRRLKADPGLLRLGPGEVIGSPEIEKFLWSGDWVDVFIRRRLPGKQVELVLVEVKTDTSEIELTRGIYQCVKYRATLLAMLRQGLSFGGTNRPKIRCILAIGGSAPNRIKEHAKAERIECRVLATAGR